MFLECSAFNGENVEETFSRCARSILTSIENGEINPDRIGSGVQFGDLSLRHLQRPNEKQRTNRSGCMSTSCTI